VNKEAHKGAGEAARETERERERRETAHGVRATEAFMIVGRGGGGSFSKFPCVRIFFAK